MKFVCDSEHLAQKIKKKKEMENLFQPGNANCKFIFNSTLLECGILNPKT